MRTFSALVFALVLTGSAPSLALDPTRPSPENAAPMVMPLAPLGNFKSEADAFRRGIKDYNQGDKAGAVRALEYAATKGHPLALWKLGRMYADGDGVTADDLKAFEYFSRIADNHADEAPDGPNARFVASAFVALGGYFLEGIPNSYVRPNPARAHEMLQYAATYYGDADAQYGLGRLYYDGKVGSKDPRQAARWLNLAAEKGHAPSQAMLGHILVTGQGVPRQVATGLMWLSLAKDAVRAKKDAWIVELHDQAFKGASDNDRQAATVFLEQHARGTQDGAARVRAAR
jgi:TPR repeat protein